VVADSCSHTANQEAQMKNQATPTRSHTRSRFARAGAVTLVLLLSACAVPVVRTTHVYEGPAPAAAFAAAEYGSVRRIDITDISAQPTGGGALIGGLIGGVLGNQVGHGAGRAAATVLGAFGGGAVGDQIEHDEAAASAHRIYHVVVHFDHGGTRSFDYHTLNGLRVGDRVRFEDGVLDRA
jgi:outer membrane lipoprotein SlyB